MWSKFAATHEITFLSDRGFTRVYYVMLVDGAAYTDAEWRADCPADWECDAAGDWTHLGHSTPDGEPGTIRVRTL